MSFRIFGVALWFVSVLFVIYGFYVTAVALTGDAINLPLIGPLLSRPHVFDKAAPILILIVFAWVLLEIALKQLQVNREHAAIATFQARMAEADKYQPKVFDLRRPRAIRRADLIIECSRREPSSLHEAVPAAASLDAGTLAASYDPLNVYAWILPVLGFIGTASGMASAIDGFKDVLRGGQVQVDKLAGELSQSVIPGLSAAFETTILALAAALVTYLCTSALRSWDQEALDQLDRLCIVLLSRIPQPPTPDGQKILAVLEQILRQIRDMTQIPATLESAARVISMTAEALTSSSNQFASAINAVSTAAEALASTSNQLGSAAETIGAAAKASQAARNEKLLEVTKDATTSDSLATVLKEMVIGLKELQKAATAPLTFTIERKP
jgi:biopolymer transport protein ExbB/TolQ